MDSPSSSLPLFICLLDHIYISNLTHPFSQTPPQRCIIFILMFWTTNLHRFELICIDHILQFFFFSSWINTWICKYFWRNQSWGIMWVAVWNQWEFDGHLIYQTRSLNGFDYYWVKIGRWEIPRNTIIELK